MKVLNNKTNRTIVAILSCAGAYAPRNYNFCMCDCTGILSAISTFVRLTPAVTRHSRAIPRNPSGTSPLIGRLSQTAQISSGDQNQRNN